jgi:large subunit ribosomal protein L21
MYAVVETGGRQYRVQPGDTIEVEKLPGAVGETVSLSSVLLIGVGADVTVGTPLLGDARVEAQIAAQKRDKKIVLFKYKRRKNYRRKQGHRQYLTTLKIMDIHVESDTAALPTAAHHLESEPYGA